MYDISGLAAEPYNGMKLLSRTFRFFRYCTEREIQNIVTSVSMIVSLQLDNGKKRLRRCREACSGDMIVPSPSLCNLFSAIFHVGF